MSNRININLLYKEYCLLRPSLSQYSSLLLFYWLGCLFGLYSLIITVSIGQLLFILATFALFRREEEGNFQKYSLFLGRSQNVSARYLFALLLALCITMMNLIILVFFQIFRQISSAEPLFVLFFSTITGLFIEFLALPLFYGLGTAQAKPWFYLLLLAPMTLIVIFYENITNWIGTIYQWGGIFALLGGFPLCLSAVLLLGLFSHKKSIEILDKKDFP